MKKLFSILATCSLLLIASNQLKAENEGNEGIQFTHDSWEAIVSKAKSENKIIFADCHTTWCGPCKMLAKQVFPQKEVGDYFNANFINVKIDCEKGEGVDLKNKFGVSAFPTMLFIDPNNEKVLHRVVGFRPAEELLKEAKGAPAEAKRAEALAAAYKKNKKDLKTTEEYLSYLVKVSDPKAEEVTLQYLKLIPKTDWHKKEYFWLMSRYVNDPFSKEAAYFYKNKAKFVEANGFQGEYFESGMYYNYAGKLTKVNSKAEFDQKKFDKLIKLMESNGFEGIEGIKDYINRALLIQVKDYSTYMDVVEEKFSKGLATNPRYYSESGFNLLNQLRDCQDKACFERALKLMDDVVAGQMAAEELDMFSLSIAYRDSYGFAQKAGITGERLAVAKAMSDLFDNIVPKHRLLLDKTYKEAQKAKEEGNTGGRAIPAMKMGGF
ncbi:thioredoxin fold domain-containing protein [Carboxylicivirga sediminis]|uniref:Thioredoxin fold domain-containing protein n=1 Tax=Carboxylicivirga sediminis TaxID=2006564 RepID=A0A941F4X4_9BACT|nr:thioredoxin family protein [Carboxylicivirga sediminis]MBR8536913.1 thioredoxin fold domain-containing protein [Carboxylicivirga sediminis]